MIDRDQLTEAPKVKIQSILMSFLDCDDPEIVDLLYSAAWLDFPTDEQVEAVAMGIAGFFDDWCDDAPYWPTEDLTIHDHDIRTDARRLLEAVGRVMIGEET